MTTPERTDRAPAGARLSGLYLLTPDGFDDARLLAATERALAAGVDVLQFRNKSAGAVERRALAGALRRLCTRHGALFIVNDDLELALAVGADGVHLGRDDGDPAAARRRLPESFVLGVSCYNDFERARAATAAGADYVAFGAVFASAVKPTAVHAPLALLARGREAGMRVVAIGGIDAGNIAHVAAAGAHAAALISAVYGAPAGIEAAVERLKSQFETGRKQYESQRRVV